MVSRSFITALALLGGVEAHTRMVEIFRNGEGQGEAAGIRMDLNGDSTTGPVTDLSSTDMACGRNGETPVGRTVKLAAGDGIVMNHRSWADGAQPGVIDSNHKGSTAVYLKKIADAGAADPWATTAASGEGWFKISWNGLDTATRQWGVDVMINNGGYTGAILPRDLDEGYYLVRDEVLGLQNRDGGSIVPQFFVGCAQVYIAGGSGGQSPETVSIPGHVSASSPSLTYDIYKEPWGEFPEFGPAVYAPIVPTSALKLNQLSAASNVAGTCPQGTVLTVGNKCFTELPTWSDDTPGALPKCWAASAACWEKNTDCWDNVEPVINGNDKSKGCSLWEAKCNNLDAWCEAGNTNGPPDAGKVISEPLDLSGL